MGIGSRLLWQIAYLRRSPPPPPIGGRTRCSRKKTRQKKRVSKPGVGAERKKGVKKRENGRKWYPNRYDQNSSHAIKRGVERPERVGNLRQDIN